MRRKRDPGTRKPLSCPLSKQRMIVCWLTLQILAASPVVNTVFMGLSYPLTGRSPFRSREGESERASHRTWSRQCLSVRHWGTKIFLDFASCLSLCFYRADTGTELAIGTRRWCSNFFHYQEVQKSSREGFANLTTDSDYNYLAKHVNANRFA